MFNEKVSDTRCLTFRPLPPTLWSEPFLPSASAAPHSPSRGFLMFHVFNVGGVATLEKDLSDTSPFACTAEAAHASHLLHIAADQKSPSFAVAGCACTVWVTVRSRPQKQRGQSPFISNRLWVVLIFWDQLAHPQST